MSVVPRRAVVAKVLDSTGSLVLAVLGVALWVIAVRQAHFARMGPLGLVSILHWAYFAGLGVVVVGFSLEVSRATPRFARVIALIVVLVLFLFGTAPAVEPVAALTDSWLHAGFTQYIVQHGHTLANFDARFSWPGGFSLAALVVAFTGQSNALALLRWFPLAIELIYLAPLLVIARFSGASVRAGYVGVALFYATNWIYQDYFSPQALNYLFFLVVIAAVIACWQPRAHAVGQRGLRSRWRSTRRALAWSRLEGDDTVTSWPQPRVLAIMVLIGVILMASAVSHQLTPYALILALVAALLTRRLARPELIVLTGLFAVGWLSLGAANYWVGHLNDIFGSVGQIGGTIGANVADRVVGSASHRLVVNVRIAITAALYGLAALGALRRASDSRFIEVAALAPFTLLALQTYGGEGLLRVVFFGLPFTALLAASALFPQRTGTVPAWLAHDRVVHRVRASLVSVVLVVLVVAGFALATTVVRGGNDAYQAYSLGDVRAVDLAYSLVQAGQSIGMVAPYLPVGQRDLGKVRLFIAANFGAPSVKYDESNMLKRRPEVIVLSRSQEVWGEIVAGYPKGWMATYRATLLRHGYRIIAAWPSASVLKAGEPA
ncbi:MAG TPA: hypothetical protein VMV53_11500 [Acidimicrobiales bacterium]|nr:hypothetical protein [Acidimicrobiales bacterium]